jgi:hypothetical protein
MTKPLAGNADHFEPGTWNAICDRCGGKFKAHQLSQTWNNLMVCARDWEPRHPQDFVRGRGGAEPAPVPWVRRPVTPFFVIECTAEGRTALPGFAIPGCVTPSYISSIFD